VRGVIERVDGAIYFVKTRDGAELRITLMDNGILVAIIKATLADIKPGLFVGSTGMPQPDGTQKAIEVHIFPEAMRGTGEGHRSMATMPGSTMTNATVAGVSSSAADTRGTMTNATVGSVGAAGQGRMLKLSYRGGEQTVFVSDKTPVVVVETGSRGSLTPGAHVIVYAQRDTTGDLAAQRISVGANGSVPPI